MHAIEAAGISATVKAEGAELISLKDGAGRELLWQAHPVWPRHAPVLFPIVGRLKDDRLRHEGRAYSLTQHGFARDSRFEWVERSPSRAVLSLSDDAASRERFPFAFRLTLAYEVADGTLSVTTRVENTDKTVLPCALGAHPAFAWPLAEGVPKNRHVLRFSERESGPSRSVVGGLLGPEKPLDFDGETLTLEEALFAADALVLPDIHSRSVAYEALGPGNEVEKRLVVEWSGYRDLGIWSKPGGADFLCIEPWFGMASPINWDGEFTEKPGILLLPPGQARDFVWRVSV